MKKTGPAVPGRHKENTMSTTNLDTLAALLIHAKPGPEDLMVDWVAANRAAQEARVALEKARILPLDADVATLQEDITATRQAMQKARLAYMESAKVGPVEAAENMLAWLRREGRLEKDMATLKRQMAEN